MSWFNAGVRAVDIRDPYRPREIGYYIPATTSNTNKRCVKVEAGEPCRVAIQTNNVEVDDRANAPISAVKNTAHVSAPSHDDDLLPHQ